MDQENNVMVLVSRYVSLPLAPSDFRYIFFIHVCGGFAHARGPYE